MSALFFNFKIVCMFVPKCSQIFCKCRLKNISLPLVFAPLSPSLTWIASNSSILWVKVFNLHQEIEQVVAAFLFKCVSKRKCSQFIVQQCDVRWNGSLYIALMTSSWFEPHENSLICIPLLLFFTVCSFCLCSFGLSKILIVGFELPRTRLREDLKIRVSNSFQKNQLLTIES